VQLDKSFDYSIKPYHKFLRPLDCGANWPL